MSAPDRQRQLEKALETLAGMTRCLSAVLEAIREAKPERCYALPNEKESTILEALRELGGRALPGEIAERAGYEQDSNFSTLLGAMTRARMLDRDGRHYVLGPTAPPPS